MQHNTTAARTLSKNEAKVVLELEWRGQGVVTLAEIRTALDASDVYARYLAHRLVKKGWLERVRPGLFRLVPAARGRAGVGDTNPWAVVPLLVQPYFLSFGTACTYHGLTEQTFAAVYVACRKRLPPRTVLGARYVFVAMAADRFQGFKEVRALGEPVQMATAERALLDAVDRPELAGGLGEVSHIVSRAARRVNWPQLIDLVARWGESALVQRLGYLLELHGAPVPDGARRELLGLVRPANKIHLGARGRWGDGGQLVRPWNVVVNVPREALVDRGHGAAGGQAPTTTGRAA